MPVNTMNATNKEDGHTSFDASSGGQPPSKILTLIHQYIDMSIRYVNMCKDISRALPRSLLVFDNVRAGTPVVQVYTHTCAPSSANALEGTAQSINRLFCRALTSA
jgi:hypothetical protein